MLMQMEYLLLLENNNGHSCHLIFKSDNNTQRTVVLSHDSTNRICPKGSDISLTVLSSGYV